MNNTQSQNDGDNDSQMTPSLNLIFEEDEKYKNKNTLFCSATLSGKNGSMITEESIMLSMEHDELNPIKGSPLRSPIKRIQISPQRLPNDQHTVQIAEQNYKETLRLMHRWSTPKRVMLQETMNADSFEIECYKQGYEMVPRKRRFIVCMKPFSLFGGVDHEGNLVKGSSRNILTLRKLHPDWTLCKTTLGVEYLSVPPKDLEPVVVWDFIKNLERKQFPKVVPYYVTYVFPILCHALNIIIN